MDFTGGVNEVLELKNLLPTEEDEEKRRELFEVREGGRGELFEVRGRGGGTCLR